MNILAVTCMRNEGPYCIEWIAHHRAAGFTHFLIYTHDCTDGTDVLLDLLPGVTHVSFDVVEDKSPQWRAMRLADKHPLMAKTDWAMFFDCDEFLCLEAPFKTAADLIESVPDDTDAIALQWRLFGSSGEIDWVTGLTTSRFTRAAPLNFTLPAGNFFKTLYQPVKFQKVGVHRPKNKKNHAPKWVLGGTQSAPSAFNEDDKRINLFGLITTKPNAWLNHYSTKSVTEFMIKRDRGLPNRRTKTIDLNCWAERNFNTITDQTIEHMLLSTLDEHEQLLELSGVSGMVHKAEGLHKESFDRLMTQRDAVMLFLHLSLLSGSVAPSQKAINTKPKRLSAAKV